MERSTAQPVLLALPSGVLSPALSEVEGLSKG